MKKYELWSSGLGNR